MKEMKSVDSTHECFDASLARKSFVMGKDLDRTSCPETGEKRLSLRIDTHTGFGDRINDGDLLMEDSNARHSVNMPEPIKKNGAGTSKPDNSLADHPEYIVAPDNKPALVRFCINTKSFVPVTKKEQSKEDLFLVKPSERSLQKKLKAKASSDHKPRTALNFLDRMVQTIHRPMTHKSVSTDALRSIEFCGSCSAADIYDFRKNIEKNDRHIRSGREQPLSTIKMLQRIMHQNATSDLIHDFKYWEDPADSVRQLEGTLLPLWKIDPLENCEGRAVTTLVWHPQYPTVFAVGYGSFDHSKQFSGMVCCYSLQDTTRPESKILLDSAPFSMAFHPKWPRLLAVGCANGQAHVVDMMPNEEDGTTGCIVASTKVEDSHKDAIWSVRWMDSSRLICLGQDKLTWLHQTRYGHESILTASADGTVICWDFGISEHLKPGKLIRFQGQDNCDIGSMIYCMDQHPDEPSLLIGGTASGEIFSTSLNDSDTITKLKGNDFPIYKIEWNRFHRQIFLTASPDWSIRIWDRNAEFQEAIRIDLESAVGDAMWAPYSSTVFAAATESGRIFVFDLSVSCNRPLCRQKIVSKSALTKIAFHKDYPILIAGDDRGMIHCMKLSPNLRKSPNPSDEFGEEDFYSPINDFDDFDAIDWEDDSKECQHEDESDNKAKESKLILINTIQKEKMQAVLRAAAAEKRAQQLFAEHLLQEQNEKEYT